MQCSAVPIKQILASQTRLKIAPVFNQNKRYWKTFETGQPTTVRKTYLMITLWQIWSMLSVLWLWYVGSSLFDGQVPTYGQ